MRFSVISAGASHTCGLVTGGYAACWGQNLSGQLGDGSREDRTAPRVVTGGRSFVSLAAGWHHTCGLSANGDVLCWGLNSDGQLGDGSRLDRLVPTRVSGPYRSVTAGNAHTCAADGEEVVCWGDNGFGQLGDGTRDDHARPVSVVNLPAAPISVAAGAVHTCALVEGGAAYCWGQNLYGQLGDGTTEHRALPTEVAGGMVFTRLFAGGAVTCGVSAEQVQYCWGLNQNGQLGDGTRVNRSRPTRAGG
jgi:alpha-tubulin suppressor-like RCC1 family protein